MNYSFEMGLLGEMSHISVKHIDSSPSGVIYTNVHAQCLDVHVYFCGNGLFLLNTNTNVLKSFSQL